ncbi:MAG: DUF2939 domain-containing protein [Acidobacteriota bacterium]
MAQTMTTPNKSLDASGGERVSQDNWSGDAFVKSRRRVNSTVRRLLNPMSTSFCPSCDLINSDADLYCANCGTALTRATSAQIVPAVAVPSSDIDLKQPTETKSKLPYIAVGAVLLVMAVVGVWFYFTPHLALLNMRSAAQNRDAKTFCSYIDFPVLKENLKSELNAKMLEEMSKDQKMKDNPYSGLAFAIAPAMINNMIDAYVSPAAIEKAFRGDFESSKSSSQDTKAPVVTTQTFNKDFVSEEKGSVSTGYESFNEFAISYKPKTGNGSKLILERRGLWGWKLVNIKLD